MYEQLPYKSESDKKQYSLIEFVENPEPRCPYIILVDSSSSMYGEPIQELNNGLKLFNQELIKNELASKRVELGVIAFDTDVRPLTDGFVNAREYNPTNIEADGVTNMGEAIKKAYEIIETRKNQYKSAGVFY